MTRRAGAADQVAASAPQRDAAADVGTGAGALREQLRQGPRSGSLIEAAAEPTEIPERTPHPGVHIMDQ